MSRFILPFQRVDDKNGHPLDGAQLYFFETGTNTPKDTYSDEGFTTPNTNPIIADSQGQFGNIFMSGTYRVRLDDKNDVTQPDYPADNVPGDSGDTTLNIASLKLIEGRSNQRIFILGYYTAGDGGGGQFYWDTTSTDTDNGGTIIKATGVTTGRWKRIYSGWVNTTWFGSSITLADNSPSINAAITYVAIAGGTVYIPEGTFDVDELGASIAISLLSGVYLRGAGMGATILKNVGNSHVINTDTVVDCGIIDITLDGDKDDAGNTSATHCLRGAGVDGLTLNRVEFKNAPYYGIGLQTGTIERIKADSIYIHDTNADGLDIKDNNLDNNDIVFNNVKASNCGIDTIALGAPQAALSIRGVGLFTNIFIDNIPADAAGFRADQSTPIPADTQGGRRSILSNFNILAGASMTTGIGVDIRADSCVVSDGYINGCYYGVSVTDSDVSVSNVVAEEMLASAFIVLDDDSREPDNVSFNQCTAKWASAGGPTRGFRIASSTGPVTGTRIMNSRVRNASVGIIVDANSDYLQILNNDLRTNTAPISDGGSNTIYDNNFGYKTFGTYDSTTIDLSSTGSKSFTITHNLPFIPETSDISLTFDKTDASTDLVVNFLTISVVGATTVVGSLHVGTAATSGGTAAKISATIISKKD